MDKAEAKTILDNIIKQVFGVANPLSLDKFAEKFTFDLHLPQKVKDSVDGTDTWAQSTNPTKFVKMSNARHDEGTGTAGKYATQPIKDLSDLLSKWDHINLTTTEFELDSLNVGESDMVMQSENIFHSTNISRSKNILYSDGVFDGEFMAACQRSGNSTYCIRVDDSVRCSNTFGATRSANLTNCIMIHDCGDMQDSMFCTNMNSGRFCIANMQFEEAEYRRLHKQVVEWILSPA